MSELDRRRLLTWSLGGAGLLAASPGRTQAPYPPRPSWETPPPHRDLRPPLTAVDPVAFWNDVCLQLVVLDHSIDAADARAPGPCCTALALALAHIAMADAVAAVLPVDYEPFLVRGPKFPGVQYPEAFVGGAVARVLEHIYNTPAHTQFIGAQRLAFLKLFGDRQALAAWNAGLSFGRTEAFTARWDWRDIRYAALQSASEYRPRPGEHDVDPFNPDQKFYGATWGQLEPLVSQLRSGGVGPGDPPDEHDREFIDDAEEVKHLGAFRPQGPTREQMRIGLYWAYDGARLIGTPPRQYNQILRQIAVRDALPLPEMARLFALCNIAMSDAGIVCWEAKYRYRIWRPVLALPHLSRGADRGWRPFGSPRTNPMEFSLGSDTEFRLTALSMLGGGERRPAARPAREHQSYEEACFTPNFPSYPSGHATFGSACFNMLKKLRAEREPTRRDSGRLDAGEFLSDELNGVSIDHLRNEPRPYLPIAYRHIDQMIEDNNKSRVYLGVHWDFDCKYGAASGARVAEVVYRHAYRRAGGHYYPSR